MATQKVQYEVIIFQGPIQDKGPSKGGSAWGAEGRDQAGPRRSNLSARRKCTATTSRCPLTPYLTVIYPGYASCPSSGFFKPK